MSNCVILNVKYSRRRNFAFELHVLVSCSLLSCLRSLSDSSGASFFLCDLSYYSASVSVSLYAFTALGVVH